MKHILFFTGILLFSITSYGQRGMHMGKRGKEIIEEEKIPYYTRRLNLTPEEAKKFWPLYDEYQDKRQKLMKRRREIGKSLMMNDSTMSTKKAMEINKLYFNIENEELDLKKVYNQKFKEILPIQKVNKLYFIERQFRIYLLKKLRHHP
ncbi:MAG TPA: hypothetical protein EYP69_03550 [Bacteroidales bacterium]|nr:hypothetical protein [Bacteroidales bacterium]